MKAVIQTGNGNADVMRAAEVGKRRQGHAGAMS